MAVSVRCQCGKEYAVPDKRAHRPFRCYVCRENVGALPQSGCASSEPPATVPPPGADRRVTSSPTSDRSSGAPLTQPAQAAAESKAYEIAAEQLAAGTSLERIEDGLIDQGLEPEVAGQVVDEVRAARAAALREAGQRNVFWGVVWCVGGLGFTVLSFLLFTQLGSSRFLVASGAIVVGGWQFVRGLKQLAEVQEKLT